MAFLYSILAIDVTQRLLILLNYLQVVNYPVVVSSAVDLMLSNANIFVFLGLARTVKNVNR